MQKIIKLVNDCQFVLPHNKQTSFHLKQLAGIGRFPHQVNAAERFEPQTLSQCGIVHIQALSEKLYYNNIQRNCMNRITGGINCEKKMAKLRAFMRTQKAVSSAFRNGTPMMAAMGWAVFLYAAVSLILPLHLSWSWKIACFALLAVVAQKNVLFEKFGGGMFFAPELPQALLIGAAWLYNALIIMLVLLLFKDAALILWKIGVRRPFPVQSSALLITALSLGLSLYGTWAALKVPAIVTHEVTLDRLPPQFDGLKIALLSDLHASAMNTAPLLQSVVDKTNELNADVVLLSGDMVDGTVKHREHDTAPLAQLRAAYGVWGVSGNHEFYSGYTDWLEKFKQLGITMLENDCAVIEKGGAQLFIAGVPDAHGARFGFAAPNAEGVLKGIPRDSCVVLIEHNPVRARQNAALGVSLQLSGHTHGGMMPVLDRIIGRMNGGFLRGWYTVAGMKLFVSPGTLLWNGFPLRLCVPSEISLIVLRSPATAV